jgi:8-oxo-dGTP pyrophosphatase MutT (NUDIX family)
MFVVNVEGTIEQGGRYLMVVRGADGSHAPKALSFPGGKVEPNDGSDEAFE